MPKELFEIRNFTKGIVSTPSEEDIPPNAATYSLNVEPNAIDGKLSGRKSDTAKAIVGLTAVQSSAFVDSSISGKKDLIYYDGNDINKVEDFYDNPVEEKIGTYGYNNNVAMTVNNKEVHIGMGGTSTTPTRWIGRVAEPQWGTEVTGIQDELSELTSPVSFPAFYKAVEDESYIYGIKKNGNYIYKLDKTTYKLVAKNSVKYTDTLALALAGDVANRGKTYADNHLWLIDEKEGGAESTLLKIRRDNLETTGQWSDSGFEGITDMVESSTKLWIGKGGAAYIDSSPVVYLWNMTTPVPGSAISIVIVNPYRNTYGSYGNYETEDAARGSYVSSATYDSVTVPHSGGNPPINITYYVPGIFLALSSDSTEKIYAFTSHYFKNEADSSAVYLVYTNNKVGADYTYEAYPLTAPAFLIDEDYSYILNNTLFLAQFQNNFAVEKSAPAPVTSSITGIAQGSADTSYIAYDNEKIYKLANGLLSSGKADVFANNSASQTNDLNSSATTVDVAADFINPTISIQGNATTPINIFEGEGGSAGLWGDRDAILANPNYRLKSSLNITLDKASGGTNASFTSGTTYFYRFSFLYDGYQESPLDTTLFSTNGATKNMEIDIIYYNSEAISPRVSHLNIYRAENPASGTEGSPSTLFRLVESIRLNEAWAELDDGNWGKYRKHDTITDKYRAGATYDAIVGISQELPRTNINYSLSAVLNNTLYIADCYAQDITTANNYMFKSPAYRYDMFDWSQDFLILPEKPTALASYNGRIFAFSENNTYRIEPNTFYIEDTFEGVGCLSPNSFVVTEYGMCFADKNNIYLHDGRQPIPIGNAIVRSAIGNNGYQDLYDASHLPHVTFDGIRNSFVIIETNNRAWCYNLAQKRWDLWSLPIDSSNVFSTFSGKDGEMYVSQDDSSSGFLQSYANGASTKDFIWQSKDITVDRSTQDKKFYSTNKVGDATVTTKSDSDATIDFASPHKGKSVRLYVEGTTGQYIDSLGVVFRAYVKVFEGVSST